MVLGGARAPAGPPLSPPLDAPIIKKHISKYLKFWKKIYLDIHPDILCSFTKFRVKMTFFVASIKKTNFGAPTLLFT
jgi:hypothetical protein